MKELTVRAGMSRGENLLYTIIWHKTTEWLQKNRKFKKKEDVWD